jgi:hypothetical protein
VLTVEGILKGSSLDGKRIRFSGKTPDDPGVFVAEGGGSIVTLLVCVGMTAYGFWLRKKKTRKQNKRLQELNNSSAHL